MAGCWNGNFRWLTSAISTGKNESLSLDRGSSHNISILRLLHCLLEPTAENNLTTTLSYCQTSCSVYRYDKDYLSILLLKSSFESADFSSRLLAQRTSQRLRILIKSLGDINDLDRGESRVHIVEKEVRFTVAVMEHWRKGRAWKWKQVWLRRSESWN